MIMAYEWRALARRYGLPHGSRKEAQAAICGQHLGSGQYREVFACQFDPRLVVKVEAMDLYGRTFSNVVEYRFWEDNSEYKPVSDWLAPCVDISPHGAILLQYRAEPVPEQELPAKVPTFLTDLKVRNFGRLNGRIVCVDYALTITTPPMRMKRAKWWHG